MHRRRPFRLAVATFALAAVATSGGAVSARDRAVSVARSSAATSNAIATKHGTLTKNPCPGQHGEGDEPHVERAGFLTTCQPALGVRIALKGGRGPRPLDVAPLPVQATLTANPAIDQPGLDGMSRSSGPDTNGEPPNPSGRPGLDRADPQQLVPDDRSRRHLPRRRVPRRLRRLVRLRRDRAPDWFDPHVIYDSVHGRWLMTIDRPDCGATASATIGTGYLFFATSDTSDPTDFWTGTYFVDDDF